MVLSDLTYTTASVSFVPVSDAIEEGNTDGQFLLTWSFSPKNSSQTELLEVIIDITVNNTSGVQIDKDYRLYYLVGGSKIYLSQGDTFTRTSTSGTLPIYVEPIDDDFYDDSENVNVDLEVNVYAEVETTVGSFLPWLVVRNESKSEIFNSSLVLEDQELTVSISDYTTTIYETQSDFLLRSSSDRNHDIITLVLNKY